jgi:hypothetical protein
MTQEEVYAEALRSIRAAEETEAVELDLSRLALDRLPRELASSPRSNRSTSPGEYPQTRAGEPAAQTAEPLNFSKGFWPSRGFQST